MARLSGWSLRDDLWQKVKEILEGTDWRSTRLEGMYQDSVPQEAGIYMIHTGESALSKIYNLPKGISGVLYVGRSRNLRNRFKQHAIPHPENCHIQACSDIFERLHFAFTPIPSTVSFPPKEWLSAAEHILISVLNPPANRSVPVGSKLVGKIGEAVSAA